MIGRIIIISQNQEFCMWNNICQFCSPHLRRVAFANALGFSGYRGMCTSRTQPIRCSRTSRTFSRHYTKCWWWNSVSACEWSAAEALSGSGPETRNTNPSRTSTWACDSDWRRRSSRSARLVPSVYAFSCHQRRPTIFCSRRCSSVRVQNEDMARPPCTSTRPSTAHLILLDRIFILWKNRFF